MSEPAGSYELRGQVTEAEEGPLELREKKDKTHLEEEGGKVGVCSGEQERAGALP